MSDIMKRLENYPDVSFIDNTSYQGLQDQMINDYERKLREITGIESKTCADRSIQADSLFLRHGNLSGIPIR